MKKSTRFFALCLALTMCVTMVMTGALGENPSPTPVATAAEGTAAPEQTAVPKLPEDILATVKGTNILRADTQFLLSAISNQYAGYGIDVAQFESLALYYTIQNEVIRQKAAEYGVDQFTAEEEAAFVTEAQTYIDSMIESNYTYFLASTSETPTEQEIADAKAQVTQELLNMGYTQEQVAANSRIAKLGERIEEILMKDIPAYTDEEIQTEYQARVDADKAAFEADIAAYEAAASQGDDSVWFVPEGIRGISHILIKVDDTLLQAYLDAQSTLEAQQNQAQALEEENVDPNPDDQAATADPAATATPVPTATAEPTATPVPVTQADVDAARQAVLDSIKDKTDDIYKRLGAGEAFAALVEQYGEDPGMQQEPYKTEGYSVHQGFEGFVPEFTLGAFAPEMQKVGDYGQPIVGTYGVHILSYTRDVPSGAVALTDERKVQLTTEMEAMRKDEVIGKAFEEWMQSPEIIYTGLVAKFDPTSAQ